MIPERSDVWTRIFWVCEHIRSGQVTQGEMIFFNQNAHPLLKKSMMKEIALLAIDKMFKGAPIAKG